MSQRNQEKDIAMGKEAFLKRKELLRGGLKRSLKKRMIKTLIWSVTLYCAETWTMRQVDIAILEAFEMWIWRRMERISWTEHYIERRSVNIGRRGKISYINNQSKTKKLDGTPAERRLSSERNNGGKNGGEERKRKTKAKTIGLDDVGGIR